MKFNSEEEKKLATVMFELLDELLSPNLVCNRNGIILFANKSYQELADEKPENKFFWKVYPIQNRVPDYFKKAVEQKIEICSEITVEDRSFIVRVIPISNILTNKLIYMVYFEDITIQINLNKQLKIDKKALQKSFLDTMLAFSELIEHRDSYTSGHQKRVALLSVNIANGANITDPKWLGAIYYGALIHDIGKIAIPMEYLVTPRRLTVDEYAIMKTHVAIGNKIIEHMDFPWDVKSVVYQHHERMDGSGYPMVSEVMKSPYQHASWLLLMYMRRCQRIGHIEMRYHKKTY
ncbi:TPA: HD domain-containing phosphohydrolase [Legionella pneumophila]|uniref:HD-GYP domain-containing protein n=1 Tax=Legionella pneumophila TaxID=446 RepID=UPI0007874747|nr:HD domain-containing phosphohydrolase [Legionella pneumophila]HAU1192136.1 HD domain-containing protein [Legionella pneumophila]HBD7101782.1 HD domain-containing protein [Legionella pneumophila]HCO4738288.1 HD domain-containing protein [Legionella pneumophila]HDU7928784.1 HD domain-containing protein [Legionella pneumophila]HDU7935149.1 HD domain-containing protein [Legionella pneumophila]